MTQVQALWRHPIKGVGRELLTSVELEKGKTLPFDRHWAIAHVDAKIDFSNPAWARCNNFARAARGHKLMAVSSSFDETTGKITLNHPELETLVANPSHDGDAIIEWVSKISDPARSLPKAIVTAPGRGMTDSSEPTISIQGNASLKSLSQAIGMDLEQERFRGNIWLDDLPAWEEFNWIGKSIQIGSAEFEVIAPIERCVATTVNSKTGNSDAPTLKTLNSVYGHQNFGVAAIVTKPGQIDLGDTAEVISP